MKRQHTDSLWLLPNTRVWTDGNPSYTWLDTAGDFVHEKVVHSRGEFARTGQGLSNLADCECLNPNRSLSMLEAALERTILNRSNSRLRIVESVLLSS